MTTCILHLNFAYHYLVVKPTSEYLASVEQLRGSRCQLRSARGHTGLHLRSDPHCRGEQPRPVQGHLRRCNDRITYPPARAAYINGTIGSINPYPGGRQTDFHNDQPGTRHKDCTREAPWPENSWRGGRDAATPPVCQRHRTRSSDRVVVLHDPTAVGCPSTTLGGCVGHAGAVP